MQSAGGNIGYYFLPIDVFGKPPSIGVRIRRMDGAKGGTRYGRVAAACRAKA
jgi:hypothetical protein